MQLITMKNVLKQVRNSKLELNKSQPNPKKIKGIVQQLICKKMHFVRVRDFAIS